MKEWPCFRCFPQICIFFTEILPEWDLMSFYFGVKLLLFQEPKYFLPRLNINHNLFSVISILSLAFFLLVLQTVIALAFLCWILINVVFFCPWENNHIQNRVFSLLLLFCFLSKPAFHTSNITEKALKKMKTIGFNPNFSVCCFLGGFFYCFCCCCCCCYDITLNLPYCGQANKIDHQ